MEDLQKPSKASQPCQDRLICSHKHDSASVSRRTPDSLALPLRKCHPTSSSRCSNKPMPHWHLGLFRPNQVQMAQGPTGRNVRLSLSNPLWLGSPGTLLQVTAHATLRGCSGGRKPAAPRKLLLILEPCTKELTAPTAVSTQSSWSRIAETRHREVTLVGPATGPQEVRGLPVRDYVTPLMIWKWAYSAMGAQGFTC